MKHKPLTYLLISPTNEDTIEALDIINRVAKRLKMRPSRAAREIIKTGGKTLLKRKKG